MNTKSRVTKIEDHLKNIVDQRNVNFKKMMKNITPEQLGPYENTVNVFQEHFSTRIKTGEFEIIPENSSFHEKAGITFKNFTNIIVELILSMHREAIGSKDDALFLKRVCEVPELSIAYNGAKDSFQKHIVHEKD